MCKILFIEQWFPPPCQWCDLLGPSNWPKKSGFCSCKLQTFLLRCPEPTHFSGNRGLCSNLKLDQCHPKIVKLRGLVCVNLPIQLWRMGMVGVLANSGFSPPPKKKVLLRLLTHFLKMIWGLCCHDMQRLVLQCLCILGGLLKCQSYKAVPQTGEKLAARTLEFY